MAVNIVSPFTAGEEWTTSARAKCIAIADAWLGASSTSGVSTWGDYHGLINPVLTAFGLTTISNGNTGQQWLDRMNVLNDAQQVMASVALGWWTADRSDLITLSGSQVTSFRDVYNAYDAVQGVSASRPVYGATGFNGVPGLTFDGTDDELTLASYPFPSGASPSIMRSVVQQDVAAGVAGITIAFAMGDLAVQSRRIGRTSSGGVNRAQLTVGDGATTLSATGSVVDFSGRHLVKGVFGGTSSDLVTDKGTPTNVAGIPSTSATRVRLGANANAVAGAFWGGKGRDWFITGSETAGQTTYIDNFFMNRRAL